MLIDCAPLPARLGGVLRVIYVLFTEGHMASQGDALLSELDGRYPGPAGRPVPDTGSCGERQGLVTV